MDPLSCSLTSQILQYKLSRALLSSSVYQIDEEGPGDLKFKHFFKCGSV